MSIAEQKSVSDLRVVYGLLANSALKEIDKPANDTREVYLINLVRMLDMYRTGKLTGRRPHGVLESKPVRTYTLKKKDNSIEQVQYALDIARDYASPGLDPENFFAKTRQTLLSLAQKNQEGNVTADSVEFVKRFVSKLAEILSDPAVREERGA
jgi:hypothetical protein